MAENEKGPHEDGVTHRVRVGESVPSIAFERGHHWATIWNHPANEELREKRRDPNILLEGDELFIPARTYAAYTRPTGKWHEFKRKGVPSKLRLRLVEPAPRHVSPLAGLFRDSHAFERDKPAPEPAPWADVEWSLTVDGKESTGKTGKDGMIVAAIKPNAQRGVLVIAKGTPAERTIQLDLGHIRPIDTDLGVIERLQNLGYLRRDGADPTKEAVAEAISALQATRALPITGEADDATREELARLHGS